MADYEVKGTLELNTAQFDAAVKAAETRLRTFVQSVNSLRQADNAFEGLNNEIRETDNELKKTNADMNKTKTSAKGLGDSVNAAKNKMTAYNASAGAARATNTSLTQSFGLASKSASSFNSTLTSTNRILRTLKTTGSIIFGMYAYQFVDAIGQSASATIKAKSEMESYYKALNMTSVEQRRFNRTLEDILEIYPKMNKYQLGETLTSLGTEFNLNTTQMEKIGKVAPMIINEYLRAGRKTEEAILAIKDISQGEFLRLSRETGVGQEEIKKAGWSGDLEDIEGLYEALEKVGKARHWDTIAQKATSLNDVMLITENRFGEFATDLVGRITPSIVNSFNTIIDAMNWLSNSWNSLGVGGQFAAITVGGFVGITAAANKLYDVLSNFATVRAANLMGIDAEIAANEGLARSYAETTFMEEMEARAKQFKITSTFEEVEASQAAALAKELEIEVTELDAAAYEELSIAISEATFAEELSIGGVEAKALALEAEALAMETGMSVEEARIALLKRENVANLSTSKVILAKILGLDAEVLAEEGVVAAMSMRLAASQPYIAALAAEIAGTIGLEGATSTLIITLGLLAAPLIALAAIMAPVIIDFNEMSASFDKVADSLANGQQKIDDLKNSMEGYQKTIDTLGNKTNLTAQETDKLNEARDGLKYTTDALKAAEEEYAYAQKVGRTYTKYTTEVEGKRYNNLKKINEELNKQSGTKGVQYTDNTYGMGRAAKESYQTLQEMNYLEEHRVENAQNLTKTMKEQKRSQQEINQYVEDYNTTLTDSEIALEKIADPNLSGWDKLGAYWDKFWADARLGWINFWSGGADVIDIVPPEILGTWDSFATYINDSITGLGKSWDSFWQPFNDFFNGLSMDNGWDITDLFHFDVPDLQSTLENGWQQAVSGVQGILDQEGSNWSSWGRNAGSKTVSSIKSGLASLAQMVRNKFDEAKQAIINKGNEWKTQAYNGARGVYNSVKNGIGDIASIVKGKFDEVVQKIRNAKNELAGAAQDAANAILNPFSWIKLPFGFSTSGPRPSVRRSTNNIRTTTPLYGSNDVSFETALRGMLTAQGFRSASSYQYYPNSRQTVSETWSSGKSNCYDGANLILSLANMFGLKGHMIAGTWNGTGHAAAVVGGKIYDMTQFQKRGTFRGTPGVYFGGGNNKAYGDNTVNNRELIVNIDMTNARIYGIDDLDRQIKESAKEAYYELNSPDKARGY